MTTHSTRDPSPGRPQAAPPKAKLRSMQAVADRQTADRGPRSEEHTQNASAPAGRIFHCRLRLLEGGTPGESIRRRRFRSCTGRSRCLRRCLCRRRSPCICRSRQFRSLRHYRLLLHGRLWLSLSWSRCHRLTALRDLQDITQDSLLISPWPRSFHLQSVCLHIRSELGQGGISIHQPVGCCAHQRCSPEPTRPQHSCTLPRPADAQAGSGPQMDRDEKG